MLNEYNPLPLFPLGAMASYFSPRQELPARVKMTDPAVLVMTDLRQVAAATIEANTPLDKALQMMVNGDVKLLLVINAQQVVIGLVTATDIQGEKPLKFLKEVSVRYEDILVRDIMTQREQLEVLHYEDVLRARVGDIVLTLKAAGRQHALVMDMDVQELRKSVRGIFSASQLGRQLGTPVYTNETLTCFAALRLAVAG
jgi:CBS-domain-containing membrane protein